ncbi:MAG TPA: kelch repeat-containing protein, partial [Thermoplasmata archaeon]|nr:kelch repeat-containing protein [Thermoplasmata archaeon]
MTAGQRYAPPGLVGASMAYDPVDNYIVLFGGCSATLCPAPAQTWKFAGGNWSQVPTGANQPPARSYASMAYDSKDGYVVLFGGWAGPNQPLNGTWAFVAGTWTNLTIPGYAPPAGGGASMTHDHIDSYLLLFGGGPNLSSPRAQTWRFVGGLWKNLTSTAGTPPSPREGAGFAWDDADGYAFLFGGRNSTGVLLNDSWTYVRGKWAPANITSTVTPPGRAGAMLTFSGVDNAVFLFGGNGTRGPLG